MNYPKFSFEVPIPNLEDFDPFQDYIFALSFLLKDETYSKYIEREISKGEKEVIIDNSANELLHSEDVNSMVNIFRSYNPDKIVVPDDFSWSETQQVNTYLKTRDKIGPDNTIGVARNPAEIFALKKHSSGIIAVPYEVRLAYKLPEYHRYHFLGLNNPAELSIYEPVSVDTSMPIKLALKNMSIQDWIRMACPHIHTFNLEPEKFFRTPMTKDQIALSIKNIYDLRSATLEEINYLKGVLKGGVDESTYNRE